MFIPQPKQYLSHRQFFPKVVVHLFFCLKYACLFSASSFVIFKFSIVLISSFVVFSIFVCDFELLHLYFFYLCFLISLFVIFEFKCLGIIGFFGFWEPLRIFQTPQIPWIPRIFEYFFVFFGIYSKISDQIHFGFFQSPHSWNFSLH